MNKILSTLAARLSALTVALCCTLTLTVFTACSKVDNPVEGKSGMLFVTTNPAGLYDQLNITDRTRKALADDGFVITDSVLIYDSKGRLVAKQGAETTRLQQLSFTFESLPNGRYTLVIWQGAISNEMGAIWKLSDEETLSTARIETLFQGGRSYGALGYDACEFTVDNGANFIAIDPKATGCIVKSKIDNFTEGSDYVTVYGTISGHVPVGIYLDPTRSGDECWVMSSDPDWYNYIFAFTPEMAEEDVCYFTLANGDDLTMWVAGLLPDNSIEGIYFCEHQKLQAGENYTFYFDLDRTGWQPPFLGSQEAFDTWKAERDAGILVGKPLLNWGCDFDEVMRYTQTTNWWYWRGEFAYSDFDEDWCTIIDVANEMDIAYMFETENGKNLRVLYVECFDESVPLEAGRKNLLAQGYRYCGKGAPDWDPRDISIFRSPDGKTEVQLYYYDDGGWTMFCYPNPGDVDHIVPGARAAARADFGQRPVPRRKGFMKR